MTRVTVYEGAPYDDENEVIADYFYNHDNKPVRIEAEGGQEIHFGADEWVDIYIDGEPVEE